MTSLPPNADELVSAYLDGEAAPDEISIVEASPELMARVEAMRALTIPLSAPLTAPGLRRDRQIAAALGVFDELMAGDVDRASDPPAVAAVPDPAASDTPLVAAVPDPDAAPPVASLEAARARRRPRRLNGLIAAAAAAVLLFVGITALSVGRGGDSLDVATEASSSAADESDSADLAESAGDAASTEADEPAGSAAAAPETALRDTPAEDEAPVAADSSAQLFEADEDAEEAMDEEAMEEEPAAEAAADADTDDGSAADSAAGADAPAATPEPLPTAAGPTLPTEFFLGNYSSIGQLDLELEQLLTTDLQTRLADNGGRGLFPDCQAEIPELAGDVSTLVGQAVVARRTVEIHLLPRDLPNLTLYVVDPTSCEVTSTSSG